MPETETKERKIPDVGQYTLQIDKVKVERDVAPPPGTNWNKTNKVTVIAQLLGTEAANDGEKPFSVFIFLDVTNNLSFERDGTVNRNKGGKFLKKMFGEIPHPLKFDEVDWEALQGCYMDSFLMHKETKKGTFPDADVIMPPKNKGYLEFNTDRKALIFNGKA